jgi:hypothetical protein
MTVDLHASLPPALERVGVVRRVMPDLFALSHPLAARGERPLPAKIGPKLGMRVSARYMNTHPAAQYTIERRYRGPYSVVAASEIVWREMGVPPHVRRFLHCETEPGREGGRKYWDVMYGGARYSEAGLPSGNAVLDPWQIRPAWVVVYEFRGTYRGDSWTTRKADIATHPYHAPRIAYMIYRLQGRSAWATQEEC